MHSFSKKTTVTMQLYTNSIPPNRQQQQKISNFPIKSNGLLFYILLDFFFKMAISKICKKLFHLIQVHRIEIFMKLVHKKVFFVLFFHFFIFRWNVSNNIELLKCIYSTILFFKLHISALMFSFHKIFFTVRLSFRFSEIIPPSPCTQKMCWNKKTEKKLTVYA